MENVKKPIIGLTPLVDGGDYRTFMLPTYISSVVDAGGLPVILTPTADEEYIDKMIEMCDGFVFTGGHDVSPELYGEEKLDCVGPNPLRDEFETLLLPKVLDRDMPVFAICRGMQLLNVILGGNLYQDIPTFCPSDLEHRMGEASDKVIHEIDIVKDTPLAKITGQTHIHINSYHHQAIKNLGKGLKVAAFATDGIIESLYMPDKKFVLAVQWHPERISKNHEEEMQLFKEFVKVCNDC